MPEHAVHHHQSFHRLYVLDRRRKSAASRADVHDVLFAEHSAFGIHVSVRGNAGVGAMGRRGAAAHALSAHRARDPAQGGNARRREFRCLGARGSDAHRDDHCHYPVPPHAGLICGLLPMQACSAPVAWIGMTRSDIQHHKQLHERTFFLKSMPQPSPADQRATRLSLGFINFAHALDHYVMLIFPTVVISLEGVYARSYAELIALGTASYVAFGIFSLPAGWLADRWSRRSMLALFYAGCGFSLLAAGL